MNYDDARRQTKVILRLWKRRQFPCSTSDSDRKSLIDRAPWCHQPIRRRVAGICAPTVSRVRAAVGTAGRRVRSQIDRSLAAGRSAAEADRNDGGVDRVAGELDEELPRTSGCRPCPRRHEPAHAEVRRSLCSPQEHRLDPDLLTLQLPKHFHDAMFEVAGVLGVSGPACLPRCWRFHRARRAPCGGDASNKLDYEMFDRRRAPTGAAGRGPQRGPAERAMAGSTRPFCRGGLTEHLPSPRWERGRG